MYRQRFYNICGGAKSTGAVLWEDAPPPKSVTEAVRARSVRVVFRICHRQFSALWAMGTVLCGTSKKPISDATSMRAPSVISRSTAAGKPLPAHREGSCSIGRHALAAFSLLGSTRGSMACLTAAQQIQDGSAPASRAHTHRRLTARSGTTERRAPRAEAQGSLRPQRYAQIESAPSRTRIRCDLCICLTCMTRWMPSASRVTQRLLSRYTAAAPTSLSSLAPIWAQRPTTSGTRRSRSAESTTGYPYLRASPVACALAAACRARALCRIIARSRIRNPIRGAGVY